MNLFDVYCPGRMITYQGKDHEEIAKYHVTNSINCCEPGDRFWIKLLPDGQTKNYIVARRVSDDAVIAIERDFAGPRPSLR